jgi:hypothetical protein
LGSRGVCCEIRCEKILRREIPQALAAHSSSTLTQFSLHFFGPAMLTNLELDGELGGDYAPPAKVRFAGFCRASLSPGFSWRSSARQRTSMALGVGSSPPHCKGEPRQVACALEHSFAA